MIEQKVFTNKHNNKKTYKNIEILCTMNNNKILKKLTIKLCSI
jgi:hypothetical protein